MGNSAEFFIGICTSTISVIFIIKTKGFMKFHQI